MEYVAEKSGEFVEQSSPGFPAININAATAGLHHTFNLG